MDKSLPKLDITLPKVDVGSFLPQIDTSSDLFSSFDSKGGYSFYSGMEPRLSGPNFGDLNNANWASALPVGLNFNMPWDRPVNLPGSNGSYNGLGMASGDASILNQYASSFTSAGSRFGIDPNVLLAIAMVEQGWSGTSPSGATGLMQIMPGGYPEGESMFPNWRTDPTQNIMLGAYILSQKIKEQGGDIDRGIMGYLGFGGEDYYGTDATEYLAAVKDKLNQLRASTGGSFTGAAGTGFLAAFGGQSFAITSENGVSNGMPAGWYAYADDVGLPYGTHPGLDVAAPVGTRLYLPPGLTGIVEIADGSDYGYDPNGGVASSGPQTGQLRIRLSNGDVLIFGHMKYISFRPNQTVYGGNYLGLSGIAGSGAHVHMEYRIRDSSTTSGWRSVDPRQYLR